MNQNKEADHFNHKFRDEDPTKFKGTAAFIIKGFKSEKDRVDVGQKMTEASSQGVQR